MECPVKAKRPLLYLHHFLILTTVSIDFERSVKPIEHELQLRYPGVLGRVFTIYHYVIESDFVPVAVRTIASNIDEMDEC